MWSGVDLAILPAAPAAELVSNVLLCIRLDSTIEAEREGLQRGRERDREGERGGERGREGEKGRQRQEERKWSRQRFPNTALWLGPWRGNVSDINRGLGRQKDSMK